MSEKTLLQIKAVSLDLGEKRVLDDLSLNFWPGYVHAVVGPNGAGKSTLANTIMGLSGYADFQGDILLEEQSLKGLSIDQRARRGITLGWQEPARYEGLSVEKFIAAGTTDKTRANCTQALDQVGLDPDHYLDRAMDRNLSGGERKRIELASIMTMAPQLVIMDEPDSGIDVEALEKIFAAIQTLKQKGTTVLLITHSQAVLEKADHAFLLCCGQLVEKGPVEKIMGYFGEKCLPCDHKNQPELGTIDEK